MFVKTRWQTVEITFPSSPLKFHSIEQYPALDEDLRDRMMRWNEPRLIEDVEGTRYTWWPDGRCVVEESEAAGGTKKVFWPIPTLADAVKYGGSCECEATGFFQFHGDGSVTCAAYGGSYYWSHPCWAEPVGGKWFDAEWDHDHKRWAFHAQVDESGYDSCDTYMTYDSTGHLYSYRRGRRVRSEDLV